MSDEQRNLYRIDDVLLRAGAIGLVVVLGGLALFAFLSAGAAAWCEGLGQGWSLPSRAELEGLGAGHAGL